MQNLENPRKTKKTGVFGALKRKEPPKSAIVADS
jgi:hypothetical protein